MKTRAIAAAAALIGCCALVQLSPALGAAVPCSGAMLGGSFKAIPNSEGAGNIVYRLRLTNVSSETCFVTGIPGLQLLGKTGNKLPTKAIFSGKPGTLTAIVVPLKHGATASLTARFSPDIPGPGEPVKSPCEKTSYKLRVSSSGGGKTTVAISPPTPVCEHGSLQVTTLTGP
jgi:hypothetical protein